jgi:hypothetical protein
MTRLRYSNAVTDETIHLIKEHMFHYEDIWNDSAVRRFIMRVGEANLDALYQLRLADASAIVGHEVPPNFLADLTARVDAELKKAQALSLKDLAVSGRDLMAIGMDPSPRVGLVLNELLEAVVDDPDLNTRERLLVIAEKLNGRWQTAVH